MKYRVRVRKYETVIRDAHVGVDASGRRKAEEAAKLLAPTIPAEDWCPPSDGQDVKYEAEVVTEDEKKVRFAGWTERGFLLHLHGNLPIHVTFEGGWAGSLERERIRSQIVGGLS